MSDFGDVMRSILRGEKSDKDIQDFLVGLNEAGLTSEQVRIGVEIMRENMTPANIPNAIDIVGTCLLYTSPSPRDRTRSRMPSSA